MGLTNIVYEEKITMVSLPCPHCGIIFGMPLDFKKEKQESKSSFYCPSGHPMSYTGDNYDKETLRQKLRDTENRLANISSEKFQLETQLNKTKHDLSRLKNGVCPCCNRSFKGLHEHIKKQHPEYKI